MLIVYSTSNVANNAFAVDTETLQGFRITDLEIEGWNGYPTVYAGESKEEVLSRFNDMVEALADKQTVYDLRKDVGYWKKAEEPEEKKSTARKRGPKPKAEESAPAEHTPAPKK